MVTHMKTTIEIADSLLAEARRVAEREGTTLRSLIEEGLRQALKARADDSPPFQLNLVTFAGDGLQPGVAEGGWDRVRGLIYEGRGA
jgi:Arc/MetJ family transcription regulator